MQSLSQVLKSTTAEQKRPQTVGKRMGLGMIPVKLFTKTGGS